MDDKQKHLRWMQMMWERQRSITREEKRKDEVLKIFEEIVEVSKHWVIRPRKEGHAGGGRDA